VAVDSKGVQFITHKHTQLLQKYKLAVVVVMVVVIVVVVVLVVSVKVT